jgi:hypothetical protein
VTVEELGKRVLAGHFVLAGEVRAADVKEAGFVDRKTGLAATTLVITYFVELVRRGGFEMAKITRRVPSAVADPALLAAAVVRGRRYAFEVESVERKPGFVSARMGNVEPEAIEPDEPPPGVPQGTPVARSDA